MLLKRNVEILNSTSDRPSRLEFRQCPSDLIAVDAIATKIRAASFRVLDATPRYNFLHHRRYLPNLVVLFGPTDIECLIVDQLPAGHGGWPRMLGRYLPHGQAGRHGVPSLAIRTSPVVYAKPTRLFTTRSARRRGETPYAVELRRYAGLKLSSARHETSFPRKPWIPRMASPD